ncbi:MBL fold metallo-hydrolase [Deinococcus sonorensis]|uniref:MBL fold metallo-hydrolase n=2 Tax=Deinococcus sonorensis TaxID=309891 RepID=A0AAU7UHJ7_9DEIO
MKQVWPGVYRHTDSAHVYVVGGPEGSVLVNIGDGSVLDALPEGLPPVMAVLLTHHHRDTAAGAARAVQLGIPVYAPEGERASLEHPEPYLRQADQPNNYEARPRTWTVPAAVNTRPLREYHTHRFGALAFTVRPTPGPTPAAVSLLLDLPGARLAFTGDLLYAPGQVSRLAATQWTYHGAEGVPGTVLSLLDLADQHPDLVLPAHGEPMPSSALGDTAKALMGLLHLRRHNTRLLELREKPYVELRPWLLWNRTSVAHSYVLRSRSGHALLIDYGYDFCFGQPSATDAESRRPWLYTLPTLMARHGVRQIDAVIPTHFHDDHVAGIPLLREAYGAEVWVPENVSDVLAHPERYRLPCLWFEPVPADRRLPLGQPLHWEEFVITPHELTGHTRYACALLVEADGERALFGGDQYADGDGLGMPYTYPNLFREGDYVRSAELYRQLQPDLILGGHTGPVEPTAEHFDRLLARGQELQRLHQALQPHTTRLIIHAEPITVECGQPVTLTIENPTDSEFSGEVRVSGEAGPAGRHPVQVPTHAVRTLTFQPCGPAGSRIHFELRGPPGEPGQHTHATIRPNKTGDTHDR